MKHAHWKKLIAIAKDRMKKSYDPVHDYAHVKRVVERVKHYAEKSNLSEQQTSALILAAWWHDVGRTSFDRPSIMIMAFIDDFISAKILWNTAHRIGARNSTVWMAVRIVLGNSASLGKPLRSLLLTKKHRILVDILSDADTLDVLHIERIRTIHTMANNSRLYSFGYRMSIWFFLTQQTLQARTHLATHHLIELLEEFIAWIQEHDVYHWHVNQFGKKWVEKKLQEAELFIEMCQKQLAFR